MVWKNDMKQKNMAEQGVTLVEVIVVLVIIGIMAAFAIPSFNSWQPNMRLKAAARDLYSSMQKAKLRAVKDGSCVGISFTTKAYNANDPVGGGGYTIFLDDGTGGGTACNASQDGSESSLDTITLSDGIFLINAAIGGATSFCYTPTSVVCGSQSGNIQLQNHKSRWYKITLTAAGGLRLEQSNDGSTWNN